MRRPLDAGGADRRLGAGRISERREVAGLDPYAGLGHLDPSSFGEESS